MCQLSKQTTLIHEDIMNIDFNPYHLISLSAYLDFWSTDKQEAVLAKIQQSAIQSGINKTVIVRTWQNHYSISKYSYTHLGKPHQFYRDVLVIEMEKDNIWI